MIERHGCTGRSKSAMCAAPLASATVSGPLPTAQCSSSGTTVKPSTSAYQRRAAARSLTKTWMWSMRWIDGAMVVNLLFGSCSGHGRRVQDRVVVAVLASGTLDQHRVAELVREVAEAIQLDAR